MNTEEKNENLENTGVFNKNFTDFDFGLKPEEKNEKITDVETEMAYKHLENMIKNSENPKTHNELMKEIEDIVNKNQNLNDDEILSLILEDSNITRNIILSIIKEIKKNKLNHIYK